MKILYVFFIATYLLLSANVVAAAPTITTKILEVQNWDGTYYFKIENPDLLNPANCLRSNWVVVLSTRQVTVPSIVEHLIEARQNDSTVTIVIGETYCSNDLANGFIAARGIFF